VLLVFIGERVGESLAGVAVTQIAALLVQRRRDRDR